MGFKRIQIEDRLVIIQKSERMHKKDREIIWKNNMSIFWCGMKFSGRNMSMWIRIKFGIQFIIN